MPGVSQILLDCVGKVTFKKLSFLPSFGGQKEDRVEAHHLFTSTSLPSPPPALPFHTLPRFSAPHLDLPFSCPDHFSSALLAFYWLSPCLSLLSLHNDSLPRHCPTNFSLLSHTSFSSKTTLSQSFHLLIVQLLFGSQLMPNPTLVV